MRGAGFLLLVGLAAAGCRRKSEEPIAGLHSAGAPLYVLVKGERRALAVGSKLLPSDRLQASGPAVIEYFGGATLFLGEGDEVEVGETREAGLVSASIPETKLTKGALETLPLRTRVMAARYADATFTPEGSRGEDPSTAAHLRAFFAPKGMEGFLGGGAEVKNGPGELPPPPLRVKLPRIHADDLGHGGAALKVKDGYAAAETDDLATAILREDGAYPLGRTQRLLLPRGAEAELLPLEGGSVELEGPLDLRLR